MTRTLRADFGGYTREVAIISGVGWLCARRVAGEKRLFLADDGKVGRAQKGQQMQARSWDDADIIAESRVQSKMDGDGRQRSVRAWHGINIEEISTGLGKGRLYVLIECTTAGTIPAVRSRAGLETITVSARTVLAQMTGKDPESDEGITGKVRAVPVARLG
ncbi:hypothetical protein BOTBODRAFT_177914 [Botryobasidium botryosum FD-172 SS1]|uniref:Uncharacterized protein n=1 Tax=Botryobasidium botryosum (strain FD-172 SS1) TaxID=930990 RepID=A0A067M4C3_BOTB1|nr:hypothetical protein BOTBODRAFT_177914 [Botryobasidium botryosum FD-172 SS1]